MINKPKEEEFYNYIIKILSLSKIGRLYSKEIDSINNFKEIHDLSVSMLENFEHVKFDNHEFFRKNVHPTPALKVIVIVTNKNNEIMLVNRPNLNGFGFIEGYVELYSTALESASNVVYDETGLKIKNTKQLGAIENIPFSSNYDEKENTPTYTLVFKAELDSKFINNDLSKIKFFDINNLPKLSLNHSKEIYDNILDLLKEDIKTE